MVAPLEGSHGSERCRNLGGSELEVTCRVRVGGTERRVLVLIATDTDRYLNYYKKNAGRLGSAAVGGCKSVSLEERFLICAEVSKLAPFKYYEQRRRVWV